MKTFKLVSLTIFHQDEQPSRREKIPLIDGLIINKEDGKNRWIVEAFIENTYKPSFEMALQNQETLNLQVTITNKSNAPASLQGTIKEIKDIESKVSVLLEGTLLPSKLNKAELLLGELLELGLAGDELLQEFRARLQDSEKK